MDGAEAPEGEKVSCPRCIKEMWIGTCPHNRMNLTEVLKSLEGAGDLLEQREKSKQVKLKVELLQNVTHTTQAEAELEEVNQIITHIDEHVLFTGVTDLQVVRAKSRETISVLIQLLVSKGLITFQDVKRVLK